MTDLPDAETAIRTILREHTHKLGVCCRCGYGEGEQFAVSEHRHRAHVASVIAAALAAASGPWAEQLDAAKARITALEEGKDGPYACCDCCPDDDPEYHAENPPNSHSTWCKSCGTPKAIADLAAALARNAECPNCGAQP